MFRKPRPETLKSGFTQKISRCAVCIRKRIQLYRPVTTPIEVPSEINRPVQPQPYRPTGNRPSYQPSYPSYRPAEYNPPSPPRNYRPSSVSNPRPAEYNPSSPARNYRPSSASSSSYRQLHSTQRYPGRPGYRRRRPQARPGH